jgi:excisionase family DNA binding protein
MTTSAASPDLDPLLDVAGVAAVLGVPVATVRKWRSESTGPPGFRIGRHVRWRREVVQAWIAEQEAIEAKRPPG